MVSNRDVPIGGRGGVSPPYIFKFARKLVKRQPPNRSSRRCNKREREGKGIVAY